MSAHTSPAGGTDGNPSDRNASAWDTAKTVAWSFFGVRKRKGHEEGGARISPVHVVIAGFVGVFLLVVGLMVLVNWIAA